MQFQMIGEIQRSGDLQNSGTIAPRPVTKFLTKERYTYINSITLIS